eukprot:g102.t1
MIACLICRTANAMLGTASNKFRYLVAGGDRALVRIVDSREDDAGIAVQDLRRVLRANPPVSTAVYIGVSCGLSATYVGAQLEFALARSECTDAGPRGAGGVGRGPEPGLGSGSRPGPEPFFTAVCAFGFNQPSDCARVRVKGWGTTFVDVLGRLMARARREDEDAGAGGVASTVAGGPSESVPPPAAVDDTGAMGRRHVLLHPSVGPEALSGSTRMKGGSATKILLEAIISTAIDEHHARAGARDVRVLAATPPWAQEESKSKSGDRTEDGATRAVRREAPAPTRGAAVARALHVYAAAAAAVYDVPAAAKLAALVSSAADSLRAGGSRQGGGNHDLRLSFGALLQQEHARLGRRDTLLLLVPALGDTDAGTGAGTDGGADQWLALEAAARAARCAGARCGFIAFTPAAPAAAAAAAAPGERAQHAERCATYHRHLARLRTAGACPAHMCLCVSLSHVALPRRRAPQGALCPVVAEFALKLCLNAVSTGAFVRCGHVMRNRMVCLNISNVKLWRRAIGIVQDLTGVAHGMALRCLLRATYRREDVPEALVRADDAEHVLQAKPLPRVLPLALLLATGAAALGGGVVRAGVAHAGAPPPPLTLREAAAALEATPVIRSILGASTSTACALAES